MATMKTKHCRACGRRRLVKFFYGHRGSKDGLNYICKDCSKKQAAEWRRGNRERFNYLRRNRERLKKYGVTKAQWDEMHERQKGRCAICGSVDGRHSSASESSLAVDHDHETGRVRGLLCMPCNRGLLATPELHRRAAQYLEENDG